MSSRDKNLPFTKLDDETDYWLLKNSAPYLVEPKIDGEDSLIIYAADGTRYAINRYGTQYKLDTLPLLSEVEWPKGTMVRAELYYPFGNRVYDFRKAIRSDPEHVQAACHDILFHGNMDLRFNSLGKRKELLSSLQFGSRINILPPLGQASNLQEIMLLYEKAIKEPRIEGVVVKPLNSIYKHNAWLKLKVWKTMDVLLTAARKDSIHDGIPWTFRMEAFIDGKQTYIGDVSSYEDHSKEDRKEIMRPIAREDKNWLWFDRPVVAEIRCHEVLKLKEDVRLREPVIKRIREDKPIGECTLSIVSGSNPQIS